MSNIKLKPCPFCGNPVWFNYNMDLEPDGVKCQACGYLLRYFGIRVKAGEKYEIAMKKIAEAWNRRLGA